MAGIMFIETLFNAVIKGEKTQTRRVIKDVGVEIINLETMQQKPRYKKGQKVYLKEPYWDWGYYHHNEYTKAGNPKWVSYPILNKEDYFYQESEPKYRPIEVQASKLMPERFKWKKVNKRFMPEKHARYFIEIINVRVERLQDIQLIDIRQEGIGININFPFDAWERLWDSINKAPYDWASNPYVFVYEFELCQK